MFLSLFLMYSRKRTYQQQLTNTAFKSLWASYTLGNRNPLKIPGKIYSVAFQDCLGLSYMKSLDTITLRMKILQTTLLLQKHSDEPCNPHLKHFLRSRNRELTQHFASANLGRPQVLSRSRPHWTPLLRAPPSPRDVFSWKARKGIDGNRRNISSIRDDPR